MPIPHQFILKSPNKLSVPPTPLTSEIVTYPYDEATTTVATNATDWQGVAQVFDLETATESASDSFVWIQFYTVVPATAGYKFKIGLYHKTSETSGELIGMSDIKTSIGAENGNKWVKVLPANGNTSIDIIEGEVYQIALLTEFTSDGEIVFKCKPYEVYIAPLKSNHITSPSEANVNTSDTALATIGFGSWTSSYYIWFGVAASTEASEEVLP